MKLNELLLNRRDEIKAQIKELRLELVQLERMLAQLKADTSAASHASPQQNSKLMTIKAMALEVLSQNPGGMDTQSIIDAIARQFEKIIERPSMSPQLSRLKADGEIEQVGHLWRMVRPAGNHSNLSDDINQSQASEVDADDLLG